jgi:NADP-dependent 3-hydroxy acid dehydrogenase YdfG
MAGRLDGTVAMVTGASSGIGAATAKRLAAQGATVACVARRVDRLADVVQDIRGVGGHALVVEADLTVEREAAAAVDRVVSDTGRLDTVVNNAGLMLVGPVGDAPAGEWERMIAINLHGVLNVTRAALPHLLDAATTSPRGVTDIVNISSTAGRVARPGAAVYSMTKFGVNAFSEALRQEVQLSRVRVAVIEPGTVDTELGLHIRDGIARASTTRPREWSS